MIADGKLIIPQGKEPSLEYQLYYGDGEEYSSSYIPKRVTGKITGNFVRLQFSSVDFLDLEVAKVATKESTDYLNGWIHASKQKRKRYPGKKSTGMKWDYGWSDCWREKRGEK